MNQDRLQGMRLQISGTLKEQWGKLTGDPLAVNAGKSDQFAGRILEQRGISAQQANRQLNDFMRRNRHWSDLTGR